MVTRLILVHSFNRHTGSNLGFSILLKDTLTCGQDEPGIKPQIPSVEILIIRVMFIQEGLYQGQLDLVVGVNDLFYHLN